MSIAADESLPRCFCSVRSRRTADGLIFCGRYRVGAMVYLFHVHQQNLQHYLNNDRLVMPLHCDLRELP